jgi:hypothetical protein
LLHVTKGGIGVDYSVQPGTMLLSVGGTSELSHAEVVGIGYGFQPHNELGMLPSVTLMCKNAAAARKAWDVFETWQAETDGDAVELTWIFSSKGHYHLIIAADRDRLRFRLCGFVASGDDLIVGGFYRKRFDSISQPTEDFRAYIRNWYSPFLFGACTESELLIGKPLLKFHASEVDEEALPPGSPERIILGLEEPPKRDPRPAGDGAKSRSRVLETHFPVTMARLLRHDVAPILDEATTIGFQRWQVEQAAANLALSSDLSPGRPHFSALQRSTAANAITDAVWARHEMADSSDFASLLADGRLLKQIVLDSNALLRSVGQQTTSSVPQVVARLRKAGLLATGKRDE